MTCYAVPAVAAIIHFFMRKKSPSSKYQRWLNQLFLGGAIFGVVDHLWNGELFLFGPNLAMDLALGVLITLVLVAVWGMMVYVDKRSVKDTITN